MLGDIWYICKFYAKYDLNEPWFQDSPKAPNELVIKPRNRKEFICPSGINSDKCTHLEAYWLCKICKNVESAAD